MASPAQIRYITQKARLLGLDPKAVLAVAAQEGLGGGVGDQGTSFGPWQLHQGGALPGSVPLPAAQNWAWSPAGLDYALGRIATVAKGLQGAQAVANIVSRFERPANPGREIAGASRAYGATPAAAGTANPRNTATTARSAATPARPNGLSVLPLLTALLAHPAAAPPALLAGLPQPAPFKPFGT